MQIATRDRFEPLCRAIESAQSRDYDDFEIVVLDDTSESLNVCEELIHRFDDPRIRCFRNEAWSGVSTVRSKMMALAEGDIYCSVDDDGAFARNSCLTMIAEVFRSEPKLGLLAGKIKDYRDGKERLLLPFCKKGRSLAARGPPQGALLPGRLLRHAPVDDRAMRRLPAGDDVRRREIASLLPDHRGQLRTLSTTRQSSPIAGPSPLPSEAISRVAKSTTRAGTASTWPLPTCQGSIYPAIPRTGWAATLSPACAGGPWAIT